MIATQTKKRILIVDDDAGAAAVIRGRLEDEGYEVDEAHCGKEGLQKVKTFGPDLVVLDVVMDDLTGYEVCAAIKSDDRVLPVIMLTSCANAINERLGYLCKVDAYIRKPLSREHLLPEVEKQLIRAQLNGSTP